ncbi:hypothetical protein PG989_009607 [Apiospora arundinis]
MLPTPDTSHVAFERVYEPAEDSYLLLDTLSSESETAFLKSRFGPSSSSADAAAATTTTTPTSAAGTIPAPFVVEIGPGSGVVIGFVNAHATHIFGTSSVLTAAIDVNRHACAATQETARKAAADVAVSSPKAATTSPSPSKSSGTFLRRHAGRPYVSLAPRLRRRAHLQPAVRAHRRAAAAADGDGHGDLRDGADVPGRLVPAVAVVRGRRRWHGDHGSVDWAAARGAGAASGVRLRVAVRAEQARGSKAARPRVRPSVEGRDGGLKREAGRLGETTDRPNLEGGRGGAAVAGEIVTAAAAAATIAVPKGSRKKKLSIGMQKGEKEEAIPAARFLYHQH